jgi:hypothetical protein
MGGQPNGEQKRKAEAIECSWLKRSEPSVGERQQPKPSSG